MLLSNDFALLELLCMLSQQFVFHLLLKRFVVSLFVEHHKGLDQIQLRNIVFECVQHAEVYIQDVPLFLHL